MLEDLSILDLRRLASKLNVDTSLSRKEMTLKLSKKLEKISNDNEKSLKKYKIKTQLGEKGKEGRTFLVFDKYDCEYAMKRFRSNKSSDKMMEEISLQRRCSDVGISPKIIDFDTTNKYIVMEKMDYHLLDELSGVLSESRQNELLNIFKKLDKVAVFHGDANILNYMIKNNILYIIDFGMSKNIDDQLIKKVGSSKPNYELMLLGFILKLKDMNCTPKSYSVLKTHLSEPMRQKYGII